MTAPGSSAAHLTIVPMTISDAQAFVEQVHRHHGPSHTYLWAVGVALGDRIVGAAVVGRPVARMLQDGWTAEVTRLATDGTPNACSKLYSACWRAAQQLGYRRLVTYILDTEPGTSLNAAGWRCVGKAGGGLWDRKDRPRVDRAPTQGKLRFEVGHV